MEQIRKAVGARGVRSQSGPAAIEAYLEAEEKGRLIQSLKSWLPDHMFTGTEVFGRRYSIEELMSRILMDLRHRAEEQFQMPIRRVTAGRPVRFVGADSDKDDTYALSRLHSAFLKAGFETVQFELEPVAAAHSDELIVDRERLILIGDFGGGTSDFSLLRVASGLTGRERKPHELLGSNGVGVAGDAFDARIIRKLVSPAFGAGSQARSLNKLLPAVPAWIYANMERWHHLSFLRTRDVTEILKGARVRALEPEKIEALINLIEQNLGYQLHQAVQQVKFDLSKHESAEFRFQGGDLSLRIPITREDFEQWISEELQRIADCIDALFEESRVARGDIDLVFLTGGSSLVPAVRRIFINRFGERRIRMGSEFTSVAVGLARCAQWGMAS